MNNSDVAIIGGGLAGLACGAKLAQRGIDFQLLEATDRLGGRVRTDHADGFVFDHGFQVLLTAYPAARELLDYDALDLRPFAPGALVRMGHRFSEINDPWRNPSKAISAALSSVGSLADKIRIGRMRHDVSNTEIEEIFDRVQQPTKHRLYGLGFSDAFVDQFLRPWFGGVFLDAELNTSSRILEFVFRMFSLGDAVVPSKGMSAIPEQLASRLPADAVRLQATVESLEGNQINLTSGSAISAKEIVIATEARATARLLGQPDDIPWQSVTCHYFSADEAPLNTNKLVLPGDSPGPIQNFCEMSTVAPSYSQNGKCLMSVSVLGDASEESITKQLELWFGPTVRSWERLRRYDIPYALPVQTIDRMQTVVRPVDLGEGPIICGDHRETSSIQGALNSGIRAAEAICGRLSVQ